MRLIQMQDVKFRWEYEVEPFPFGRKKWFLYLEGVDREVEILSVRDAHDIGIKDETHPCIYVLNEIMKERTMERVIVRPWKPYEHTETLQFLYGKSVFYRIEARRRTLIFSPKHDSVWMHVAGDSI
jgi:hypothetical protein